MKRLMNNKGVMDPFSMLAVVVVGFAVTCTGLTYASGGKELAKKNWQSIVAHAQGACAEGSTDSRCIMK